MTANRTRWCPLCGGAKSPSEDICLACGITRKERPQLEERHVPAERSNTGIAYDEIVYKRPAVARPQPPMQDRRTKRQRDRSTANRRAIEEGS